MEKELLDKYERLLKDEDHFMLTKMDLVKLTSRTGTENGDSFRHLKELGGINGLLSRLDVNPSLGVQVQQDVMGNDLALSTAHSSSINDLGHKHLLRKKLFGVNHIVVHNPMSIFDQFIKAIKEPSILFLLLAASIRLSLDVIQNRGHWFDYSSIYLSVLLICVILAITNFTIDNIFNTFRQDLEDKDIRVIRNGTEKLISKSEVVVGDIIIANAGDIISVDGIVIKTFSLTLEFEGKIIKHGSADYKNYINITKAKEEKIDEFPIVFSGSKIIKGSAYILTLVVGYDTDANRKTLRAQLTKKKSFYDNHKETINNDYLVMEKSNISIKYNSTNKLNEINKINKQNQENESNDVLIKSKVINVLEDNFKDVEDIIKQDTNNNEYNKNRRKLQLSHSYLKQSAKQVKDSLFYMALFSSVITCLFFLITYMMEESSINNFSENKYINFCIILFDAIIYGVIIIVVAVPEGINLTINLSLAFSLQKMKENKTMVKSIEACENMATIDTIYTDFSGILTKSEMKFSNIFIEDKQFENRQLDNLKELISEDLYCFLVESLAINTSAFGAEKNNKIEYIGSNIECSLIRYLHNININYNAIRNNKMKPVIDCSINSAQDKLNFTIIEMDEKRDYVRLYVKGNFDSLIEKISIYIGANLSLENFGFKHDEKLRQKCINLCKNGFTPLLLCYRDIDKNLYYETKNVYSNRDREFNSHMLRNLTFIAMIGLKDELKNEIDKYVLACQSLGVDVRMITSLDKETARVMAEQCQIVDPSYTYRRTNTCLAVQKNILQQNEGETEENNMLLSKKSESNILDHNKNITPNIINRNVTINNKYGKIVDAKEDLRKYVNLKYTKTNNHNSLHSFEFSINDLYKFNNYLDSSKVICKASANDKFILIAALKKKGHKVALTGDGVSDSLAMKIAHVGISMGYRSSDVSKESADIILMDDNFKSIVTTIIYSRHIYDAVRRFLQFQITISLTLTIFILIAAFPFTNFYFYPNQLLYLNLIIDIIISIGLASDLPLIDKDMNIPVIKNQNNFYKAGLFTRTMIIKIIIQSFIQLVLLLGLLFIPPLIFDIGSDLNLNYRDWENNNGFHTTIVFNCTVLMQILNAFISRRLEKNSIKHLLSNLGNTFVMISISLFLSQILVITYAGRLLRVRTLYLEEQIFCICYSCLVLLSVLIFEYLPNRLFETTERDQHSNFNLVDNFEENCNNTLNINNNNNNSKSNNNHKEITELKLNINEENSNYNQII